MLIKPHSLCSLTFLHENPEELPLNTASFIIGKYFLVVYRILYTERLYTNVGYHLGRK